MFQGIYNGKAVHTCDIEQVLKRAAQAGVESIIITGTNYEESIAALKLTQDWQNNSFGVKLYSTAGVHPTCATTESQEDVANIKGLLEQRPNNLIAVGECGLDYDRLKFSNIEDQKR